jgi:hypothetical protein
MQTNPNSLGAQINLIELKALVKEDDIFRGLM